MAEYALVQQRIQHVPFSHLHRFCRLLARNRPKTHRQFLRLLSVMTYIKHCGGELKKHEFNALIDHAGKGWRKTHPEDVAKAMGVFNDLMAGRMPGSSEYAPADQQALGGPPFQPDIYTVTSLISIAARGEDTMTLRGLSALMRDAELTPNRITHLAMLRYFVERADMTGFRATLQKMRQLGLDLGLDGLNACIMAYSQHRRLDVVLMVYRLLRHNMVPELYRGEGDINDAVAQLGEEFIFVEEEIVPDKATYTSVIQTMAYHGQFRGTIEVFIDMLSSPNEEPGAPLVPTESGELQPARYEPTPGIYRAIFLGFSKYAVPPFDVTAEEPDWTHDNLLELFDRFLALPPDTHLTQANVYIVMAAFAKTTASDLDAMRDAWKAIDGRFGIKLNKPDADSRLVKLKKQLFPDDRWNPG
ncbi:hypothetical protein BDZ97DRAFT_1646799 [Flammula alnicola]|nr:hypothetical protein BDZ97DRAFT_1646799 [Flammula alnicola]